MTLHPGPVSLCTDFADISATSVTQVETDFSFLFLFQAAPHFLRI